MKRSLVLAGALAIVACDSTAPETRLTGVWGGSGARLEATDSSSFLSYPCYSIMIVEPLRPEDGFVDVVGLRAPVGGAAGTQPVVMQGVTIQGEVTGRRPNRSLTLTVRLIARGLLVPVDSFTLLERHDEPVLGCP